ncbi:MAG: protein kinase [Candidatus Wallbacteria bacterium]|nr:protein kinase [Candidatus Wallbacteria bacterium]
MHQFECPGCSAPIYSKNPKEQGGFRCVMCGFMQPPIAGPATPPPGPIEAAEKKTAEPEPAPAPEGPALPEEWELIRLLGQGGMGQVWSARHKLTGDMAAVKCLLGSHVEEPQYAKRFAQEVQVLHRLDHPHVVRLLYSGIHQGRPWLAMELVNGPTLRSPMEAGKMAPEDVVRHALEIADALDYTHKKGVVHRDLKPENVLLDPLGGAKVTDFGLAGLKSQETRSRLTSFGMVMGTIEYMAPEQLADTSGAGPPADLYSLGVILFEMLTSRKPHGQERPSAVVKSVSVELDQLVCRLLERSPSDRPSSAAAVVEELKRIEALLAARPGDKPVPEPPAHVTAIVPAAVAVQATPGKARKAEESREPPQAPADSWSSLLKRCLALAPIALALAFVLRSADNRLWEAFLRVRGSSSLDGRLLLVDLVKWPRSREELARAVTALHTAGARVVALDVMLDLVESSGPRGKVESQALAEAMRKSGPVLAPSHIRKDGQGFDDPEASFGLAKEKCGFCDFRQLDGKVWKTWLLHKGRPAFSLATVLEMEGRTLGQVQADASGRLRMDDISIPASGEGSGLLVNYVAHTPPGGQILALDDVLSRADKDPQLLADLCANKLALIGRLTPDPSGISQDDRFRVPVMSGTSNEMAGTLIHANIIQSLLRRQFLDRTGTLFSIVLALLALGAGLAAPMRLSARWTAGVMAGLGVGGLAAAAVAFSWGGLLVPLSPLLAGLGTAAAADFASRSRTMRRMAMLRLKMRNLRLERLAILRIESRPHEQNRIRYSYQLSYLDTQLAPASTPSRDYLAFQGQRHAIVEACDQLTRERLDNLVKEVESIGRRVHAELLGPEFGTMLKGIDSDFAVLEIDEAEVELPWELARQDGPCLGERLSIGRRLLVTDSGSWARRERIPDKPLKFLCVASPVSPGVETLPDAEEEARELLELMGKYPEQISAIALVGPQASLKALQEHLREGVDILHFSGHSQYVREAAGSSGLVFPEGILNPDNLRALVGSAPPSLIYLNSCESAKVTQQGTWGMQVRMHVPRAFVQSGVSFFIGSLWQIEDSVARTVALRFYEELLSGLPIGTSLKLAKGSAKNEWMTQAAYVLYGDPRVTIETL